MTSSLLGKLAFVTGAGSGIGRATCLTLAREGAKVIATDQNEKSAKETIKMVKEKFNDEHISAALNVSDSKSIKAVLNNVLEVYKNPPTVIVNCAGITRDNFTLGMSEEDFQEVLDVNLKGTFLVMQIFAQAIIDRELKNASIINMSSIVGKYGNLGQANYSASKAGVEAVTKTAAKEFGPLGIRCNAILPGFIASPMTDAVPEKVREKFLKFIPMKRFGQPKEVAELITFLASDKSSYINGASIDITGGF